MIGILRIIRYEFLRNFRRRGYLFTTFGVPIIFLLIAQFGGQLLGGMTSNINTNTMTQLMSMDLDQPVGIVDQSGVFVNIPQDDNLTLYPDLAAGEAAVNAGTITTLFVIPPDYVENGDIEVVMQRMSAIPVDSNVITNLLLNQVADSVPESMLMRLSDPTNMNMVDLSRNALEVDPTATDTPNRTTESDFWVVYVFVLAFIMTSFASTGYLMQSVIEEKQNRIVEVLLSSVRPFQLLVGKVLANGGLGLFQIGVWISFALWSLNNGLGGQALAIVQSTVTLDAKTLIVLVLNFVLGYLTFAAVFGGVSAISTSTREGPQFATIFIIPSMIPIFVLPFMIELPNSTASVALSIIPFTSPIGMVVRVLLIDVPLIEIVISISVMILTIAVLFWFASRLFRVNALLAGQVPKLSELPRLLFGRS